MFIVNKKSVGSMENIKNIFPLQIIMTLINLKHNWKIL